MEEKLSPFSLMFRRLFKEVEEVGILCL